MYFANLKSAKYFLSFGQNCKYFKNEMSYNPFAHKLDFNEKPGI